MQRLGGKRGLAGRKGETGRDGTEQGEEEEAGVEVRGAEVEVRKLRMERRRGQAVKKVRGSEEELRSPRS